MIGIIGAMKIETDGIINKMTDIKTDNVGSTVFSSGKIYGKDIVCAMCNPGKVNAALCAQAMILKYKPDVIINSGIGGALDNRLNVFDVVIAESLVEHDYDISALGCEKGMIEGLGIINLPCDEDTISVLEKACQGENTYKGIIATGDLFVSKIDDKLRIKNSFNAIVCEMEGAAIAHVCYCNNVKCAVLRVISDSTNEVDYNTFKNITAEKSISIMEKFIALCN